MTQIASALRLEGEHMVVRPSNRQLKLLRFFDVQISEKLSAGAAGWEIARLMEDVENCDRWRRYLTSLGTSIPIRPS